LFLCVQAHTSIFKSVFNHSGSKWGKWWVAQASFSSSDYVFCKGYRANNLAELIMKRKLAQQEMSASPHPASQSQNEEFVVVWL
jgi:hypothetical protein